MSTDCSTEWSSTTENCFRLHAHLIGSNHVSHKDVAPSAILCVLFFLLAFAFIWRFVTNYQFGVVLVLAGGQVLTGLAFAIRAGIAGTAEWRVSKVTVIVEQVFFTAGQLILIDGHISIGRDLVLTHAVGAAPSTWVHVNRALLILAFILSTVGFSKLPTPPESEDVPLLSTQLRIVGSFIPFFLTIANVIFLPHQLQRYPDLVAWLIWLLFAIGWMLIIPAFYAFIITVVTDDTSGIVSSILWFYLAFGAFQLLAAIPFIGLDLRKFNIRDWLMGRALQEAAEAEEMADEGLITRSQAADIADQAMEEALADAHRPTWAPAQAGHANQSSKVYSSRDLNSHTRLKFRQAGQGNQDDVARKDLKLELLQAERQAAAKKGIEIPNEFKAPAGLLENGAPDVGEDESAKRRKVLAQVGDLDKDDEDDDDEDDDEGDEGEGEGTNGKAKNGKGKGKGKGVSDDDDDEDDDSDEDDDEDETAELLKELEKIKRERAEEKEKAEREKAMSEQTTREEEIAMGNPLLNLQSALNYPNSPAGSTISSSTNASSFGVKRRWDDDVIFKNQARGVDETPKSVFVNDLLRTQYHKKFMKKFVA